MTKAKDKDAKVRILYLLAYLIPIVFTFITYYSFQSIGFVRTDPDSARYLLSALVQCEAAIMAIVVTLSLITIQLAASSYSPRLIDIFIGTPIFWLLVIIYIYSMVLSLTTLRLIEAVQGVTHIEDLITLCFLSGVLCFSALFSYTLKMIDLLRPRTIISELVKSIKKSKDLEKIKEEVSHIFAIISGSLSRYDHETAVEGLRTIRFEILEYLKDFTKTEKEKTGKLFFDIYWWIRRLSNLLTNYGDEESISESIVICSEIGKIAVRENFGWIGDVIWFFEDFGKILVEKDERVSLGVLVALEAIWEDAIKYKRKWMLCLVPPSVKEIGKVAIERRSLVIRAEPFRILQKFKYHCMNIGMKELGNTVDSLIHELNELRDRVS